MKTFGIDPKEVEVSDFSYNAISLGERGRGRKITNVACPKEQTEFLEVGTTKSGKPRLNKSSSAKGWIARISTEGAYIRGANGNISISKTYFDSVRIVARGHGAFGAAGRTGTWDDILISTKLEEFWLRVKPSRGDAYILWFHLGKVSKLSYDQLDLLDEIDAEDSRPTSKGSLIRL